MSKNREFSNIFNKDQLKYLVDHYLSGKSVYIKGVPRRFSAELSTLFPKPVIKLSFPKKVPNEYFTIDTLTIYAVVKRYIEVIVKKIYFEENKGDFELVSAKIAHDNRIDKRIVVTDKDFYAENFRLSQYSINPNTIDMPISVKVAFDKTRPSLLKRVPNCGAYIYNEHKEDRLSQATRKTKKIIYIEDVYKSESFSINEKGFLNCYEYFGDSLDKEINNLILKNICSILIYPVIFVNIKGEGVPIGYFKVTSTEANTDKGIIFHLDSFAVDIANYTRDANVKIIKERQQVTNVSRKGVQLLINDLDVLDTFIGNRDEIVFDIRPKPTFRITLFAKMVNVHKATNNNYLIGLKVIGGSKRHGIGAWDSYITRLLDKAS